LTAVVAWLWLRRTGIELSTRATVFELTKVAAAATVAGLIVWLIPAVAGSAMPILITNLVLDWAIGLGLFLVVGKLFKVEEIGTLSEFVSRKFKRS
ncbi:MAG: hypothetical protein RL038_1027, partial [Actinomycetota bacterium]